MAPLALHSRCQPFELQAALVHRVGRMTVKAIPRFRQSHDPARRFFEVTRRAAPEPQGQVRTAQRSEVSRAALVPMPVPLVHVGLSRGAQSKRPGDGYGQGLMAIGHAVEAAVPLANYLVGIGAVTKSKFGVGPQDRAVGNCFERVSHGSRGLGERLYAMAGCTDDG